MKAKQKLGFLSICADRRYWSYQTAAVQVETGLSDTDFWIDARAGGAGKLVKEEAFAAPDHAYHSGARTMVWGMHGDKCGGFPELSNQELQKILEDLLPVVKERYPEAKHFSVWSKGPNSNVATVFKEV